MKITKKPCGPCAKKSQTFRNMSNEAVEATTWNIAEQTINECFIKYNEYAASTPNPDSLARFIYNRLVAKGCILEKVQSAV